MTENQCTINVPNTSSTELAKEWARQVTSELEKRLQAENSSNKSERWKKQSIYKLPSSVTKLCKEAYEPQAVSIGPYHHGKEHLKGMEEHKLRALRQFLNRSGKPLEFYVDALALVVEDLKDAYDQLDESWEEQGAHKFLELMIVDGCFILELMRTTNAATTDDDQKSDLKEEHHADINDPVSSKRSTTDAYNDPVFSKQGKLYIVPDLKRDMLMLENQLPMLVLTTLLSTAENDMQKEKEEVTRVIVNFFSQQETDKRVQDNCLHILDVYRKSLLLDDSTKMKQSQSHRRDTKKVKRKNDRIIHSATDLREAGVRIKQSKTVCLNDINFHGGVLELPRIVVDNTLESQYLNLMAFERFHVEASHEITSYVLFMDNLIDSQRDVTLLHKRGIVRNEIGSHKAIANLFNSSWTISRGISLGSKSSLDHVSMKISDYCQQPCPKWRATLKHRYFTNPWAGLSVFAAVFLFALAGFQTVYTILSYYDPNK